MVQTGNIGWAFLLTVIAGLSTGIGSALVFFAKKTNPRILSVSLGFSAGVMIYISFAELFSGSRLRLAHIFGRGRGDLFAILSFFGGIALMAIIDRLLPEKKNPHEARRVEEIEESKEEKEIKLYRMGMLTALTIGIHNLPEGVATFASALQDISLGIAIAVAIAIHNIPEGIAVAIPVYYATGNKKKAFFYSFLSGLAEPVGALLAFVVLMPFINEVMLAVISSIIAGIMVFISLDELLPTAREYGFHHLAIYGLMGGMAIMAVSLLLLI